MARKISRKRLETVSLLKGTFVGQLQRGQHFRLALRVINTRTRLLLNLANFERDLGALIQQVQDLHIDRIYFVP